MSGCTVAEHQEVMVVGAIGWSVPVHEEVEVWTHAGKLQGPLIPANDVAPVFRRSATGIPEPFGSDVAIDRFFERRWNLPGDRDRTEPFGREPCRQMWARCRSGNDGRGDRHQEQKPEAHEPLPA
jgi:hypothetical protein